MQVRVEDTNLNPADDTRCAWSGYYTCLEDGDRRVWSNGRIVIGRKNTNKLVSKIFRFFYNQHEPRTHGKNTGLCCVKEATRARRAMATK